MPIDLYYFRFSGPSRAILMTVRQLNLNVNLKHVDLTEGEQNNPEFLKINPGHEVPVIIDNGFTLCESRAIMQYLCNAYASDSALYPTEPKARALVDRWLYFDNLLYSGINSLLRTKSIYGLQVPEETHNNYKKNLKLIDQLIGDKPYLTGNGLTLADLTLLATTANIEWYEDFDFNEYPNYRDWSFRLKSALPYYEEINVV
ncbi:unnamed protein product [Oppiella nova]|uniref:Glutathione S-transferase n=1 Tax=Oppiella nova TaxID=334625 RepID=A0A7R9LDY4_9ACAR|nr:unnamed protein product [Oppiella nova]CAG2162694.1 unnamed protein product [Oppiella nova]